MNKIAKTSPDLLKERVETLKKLFPDLVSDEGNINEEEIRNLVTGYSTPQTERYEFRWAGKSHSKKLAFTPSKATLVPDNKRSIDFDKTENMIIEGDNLEVLKLMQKAYANSIKCIYIDPPYNTGNDFIYNDDFSESKKAYWEKGSVAKDGVKLDTNSESAGRYHSNWLDMMQSRILLARNLLREDGVIFVSIDDHEVVNLRKLMDEIFGEEMFIANFIWKSRQNKDNRNITGASIDHEYVLCYGKRLRGDERDLSQYSNSDNDPRGEWTSANMVGLLPEDQRPNCHYDLINPITKYNYGKPTLGWRYDKKRMDELIKDNKIIWPKNPLGRPRRKLFKTELQQEFTGFSSIIGVNIYTRDGTAEVERLFKSRVIEFPKPIDLIKELLIQGLDYNEIVLDFFAGSGTTGHAVMELNKEDGGNRKYILVQLPEATDEGSEARKAGFGTISDICIERVKRVGKRIEEENKKMELDSRLRGNDPPSQRLRKGKQGESSGKDRLDTGFKVFKLTYSHFPENLFSPDPDKSGEENIKAFDAYLAKMGQQTSLQFDPTNMLFEIAIKDGFQLNFQTEVLKEFTKNQVVKIHDDIKEAVVCLDNVLQDETVEKLKSLNEQRFICLQKAVDTTKKWNLQQIFAKNLWVV